MGRGAPRCVARPRVGVHAAGRVVLAAALGAPDMVPAAAWDRSDSLRPADLSRIAHAAIPGRPRTPTGHGGFHLTSAVTTTRSG